MRYVLPGCSLLLWSLFMLIGLSMQLFTPEQARHFRWLPALMALGSLALIFLSGVRYAKVAAQLCAALMILFSLVFFFSFSGGV